MLRSFNLIGSFPDNRVYLHLAPPETGGWPCTTSRCPSCPLTGEQMLLAAHRSDVHKFTESMLTTYETPFAVGRLETPQGQSEPPGGPVNLFGMRNAECGLKQREFDCGSQGSRIISDLKSQQLRL